MAFSRLPDNYHKIQVHEAPSKDHVRTQNTGNTKNKFRPPIMNLEMQPLQVHDHDKFHEHLDNIG